MSELLLSQTLFGLRFLNVIFFLPFTVFLLSLSPEIRIKKIRILEVLEPLQCEEETGHLLRLQREASCINVFQVDYCNWFFQWIFYAIGYWSGFSLKEFFIGFPLAKTLCLVIVYSLFTGYNLKKKKKKLIIFLCMEFPINLCDISINPLYYYLRWK